MRGITVCPKHQTSHLDGDGCFECLLEKHEQMDIVDVLLNEAETLPEDCARAAEEIERLRAALLAVMKD